ncbi:aminoacyl-tRNA deacylase [Psychromonas sp.]|uniref:aminoacyl-tRNA deacylase n=1 Tax=Psychromonas sp. TaxID=1884585 RepID=UPI00356970E8
MSMAETVKSYMAALQIDYDLLPHPKTYNSRESAEAAHIPEDHIAKAVIVKDARGYAMVVIPGRHWLKLKAMSEEVGREFSLAEEAEINKLFNDCQSGAIPPVGPAYQLATFMDQRLLALANIFFEAGDHEHLVHVDGKGFHKLLKGARHGYFSHNND